MAFAGSQALGCGIPRVLSKATHMGVSSPTSQPGVEGCKDLPLPWNCL